MCLLTYLRFLADKFEMTENIRLIKCHLLIAQITVELKTLVAILELI